MLPQSFHSITINSIRERPSNIVIYFKNITYSSIYTIRFILYFLSYQESRLQLKSSHDLHFLCLILFCVIVISVTSCKHTLLSLARSKVPFVLPARWWRLIVTVLLYVRCCTHVTMMHHAFVRVRERLWRGCARAGRSRR